MARMRKGNKTATKRFSSDFVCLFLFGGVVCLLRVFCVVVFVCCFIAVKELGLIFDRRKTSTLTCQRDRKEITRGQADL